MRKFGAIVVLLSFSISASAAEIDFSVVLKTPKGEPYQECAKTDGAATPKCVELVPMTLGMFSADALNTVERGTKLDEMVKRGQLAARLAQGGKQEIDTAETALILKGIDNAGLSPLLVYTAVRILDPANTALKKP